MGHFAFLTSPEQFDLCHKEKKKDLTCSHFAMAAKTCAAVNKNSVDTSTCAKVKCKSGEMCYRTSMKTTAGSALALLGCFPSSKAECKSITSMGQSGTACTCDKDLCNGAQSAFASLSSIGIGLVTFFALFYARG